MPDVTKLYAANSWGSRAAKSRKLCRIWAALRCANARQIKPAKLNPTGAALRCAKIKCARCALRIKPRFI